MRPQPSDLLEEGRVRSGPWGSHAGYGNNGLFIVTSPFRSTLKLLASDQLGWEHVSVSVNRQARTPTWEEMCWAKGLFWADDECVVQYHPPETDYINLHPHTLHLWRPTDGDLPRPPHTMVGPKTADEAVRLARALGAPLSTEMAETMTPAGGRR